MYKVTVSEIRDAIQETEIETGGMAEFQRISLKEDSIESKDLLLLDTGEETLKKLIIRRRQDEEAKTDRGY